MRILRKRDVVEKIGRSAASLYRDEKAGLFPKRVNLGANCVGWLESEVDQWIADRASERDENLTPSEAA